MGPIIYFKITRGFDDIFKQGREIHAQSYKIKREITFTQKLRHHLCWKLANLSFLVDFIVQI